MTIVARGFFCALAALVLSICAAHAQAPQAFNVLDQVEYDPRTQKVSLAGHYDPAFGSQRIPYLQYFATFLDYPRPRFSLDPTPESRAAWNELSKRLKSEDEWKKIVAEWGEWIDDRGAVTPSGRGFLKAFGVTPPGPPDNAENPWSKYDRYQVLARIFLAAGNERASAVIEAFGKTYKALPNITPELLKELLDTADASEAFNRAAEAVKKGEASQAQGLQQTYRAFFQSIDKGFELANNPATGAFDAALGENKPAPAAIESGLREFDRQFQTIYQLALVKLWETRGEVHVSLTDFTPSLRDKVMITLVFYDLPRNSLLAKLMFESDYFLKYLNHMPELAQRIPEFKTEALFNLEKKAASDRTHRRMWVTVDSIDAARSPNNNMLAIADTKMRINIRRTDAITGNDLPDQEPGEYEILLTSLYDDLARAFPQVFHELREAGKLSYAAQWLKAKNPRLKMPEAGRAVWNGPAQIPALVFLAKPPKQSSPDTDVTGWGIEGGVELQAPKPSSDKLPSHSSINPAGGRSGCKLGTASDSAIVGSGGANAVLIDCNEFGRPIDFKFLRDQNPKPGQGKAGPGLPDGKAGKSQPSLVPAPPASGPSADRNTPPPPPPPSVAAAPPPPPPPQRQASKADCFSRAGTPIFGQRANEEGVNLCDDSAPAVDLNKSVPLLRVPEPPRPAREPRATSSPEVCKAMEAQIAEFKEADRRARLTQHVMELYDPKRDRTAGNPKPAPGFTLISDSMQEMRKLLPKLDERAFKELTVPENSDYRAAVYRENATGKTFLVFRDTKTLHDWTRGNIPQGFGARTPEYYEKAKALGKLLKSGIPDNEKLEIVGYSLGGGMAAAAAKQTGSIATTFNAPGVHPNTLGSDAKSALAKIASYAVDGEPVSYFSSHHARTVLESVGAGLLMAPVAGPFAGLLPATAGTIAALNAFPPPDGKLTILPAADLGGGPSGALLPLGQLVRGSPLAGAASSLGPELDFIGAAPPGSIERHMMRNVRKGLFHQIREMERIHKIECTVLKPGEVPPPLYPEPDESPTEMREWAELLGDIAAPFTPAGIPKDIYEAATGRSVWSGRELSGLERGAAILGTVSFGISDEAGALVRGGTKLARLGRSVEEVGALERLAVKAGGVSRIAADDHVAQELIEKAVGFEPLPGQTVTMIGGYEAGMKEAIQVFHAPKSMANVYGDVNRGWFNILNVPPGVHAAAERKGPDIFWNVINRPLLDKAIERGDLIFVRTKPTRDLMYHKGTDYLTGFGMEMKYLISRGLYYDPVNRIMRRL